MFWSRKIRFEAWLSEAVVVVVGNPLTFFGEGWKRKWNVISVHTRLSLFFLSAVFLFHRLIFFLSVCLSLLLLFLLLFVCRLRLWSPYPGECVDCCWCHCHCCRCCCFILNISFFIRSLSSIKSTHSHNMRYIIFFSLLGYNNKAVERCRQFDSSDREEDIEIGCAITVASVSVSIGVSSMFSLFFPFSTTTTLLSADFHLFC